MSKIPVSSCWKSATSSSAITEIPRDALSCEIRIWGRAHRISTDEYLGEYKFLLEFYTNFVSILYSLWDIAEYLCDIATFQRPYLSNS